MAQKILIVDDDPLTHLLFKHHLERAGFQLLAAKNGAEGLEMAASERPELIIMDIMMPDMDGFSVIRELRKAETTRTIPIIVVTAIVATFDTARQESQLAGASAFLTKPLNAAQLVKEIRRFVPPETGAV